MDELARRVAQLRAHLDLGWTDLEVESALSRLHARRARRRAVSIGATALVALAGVAFLVASLRSRSERGDATGRPILPIAPQTASTPSPAAPPEAAPPAPIALGDGSVVTPLVPATRLETGEISPSVVTVRLLAGSARFHVVHQPARVFRVVSGEVSTIDLGTDFTVVRDGETSIVEVQDGRVRVEWRDGVAEMVAGERRRFPPAPAPDPAPVHTARSVAPHKPPRSSAAPTPGPAAPGIEDLLRIADQARLHGDPGAAVEPLRRVIADHPGDPRAPLAAFTLGRVLLEELNDPPAAAAAFAHARALAPAGPLAEDALAREVEAWERAGERNLARARAKEYLGEYPQGHRVREVRERANLP